MKRKFKIKLSVWQILSLGYLAVILLGTALLLLPFATKTGERTNFINALFTSASATCVTGLVVYDTNTHWSLFGQIVLLFLIQLGGLGFMTLVTLLFRIFRKNKGINASKIFMATAGESRRSELGRLLKRILFGTLLLEGLGAGLLSIRFIQDFGPVKGIYYAIWHSVSAFCNAGFDLMGGTLGQGQFVSFTHYATDPIVSLPLAGLIVVGGLGFCVWDDITKQKFRLKKTCLHTKTVLVMTVSLLTLSTLLFLFFERGNQDYKSYNFGERILVAFFSAVTPRTAGFNTVDLSALSDSSYLLTVLLMFVGGSSASTAGGIKITTLFVVVMGMMSVFRGKQDIEIGKRRVHNSLLRQALAITTACIFILITATLLLCTFERDNQIATLQAVLFETTSALGTVGVSLSLTPTLCVASKIVLILLMYTGRAGILTVGLAFAQKQTEARVRKPVDTLLIG